MNKLFKWTVILLGCSLFLKFCSAKYKPRRVKFAGCYKGKTDFKCLKTLCHFVFMY